ncbi:hypothetical protein HMPREF1982_00782 [Clostridiales bacterium oral taxon 876 str. F0540]|nr:hypothetical protein HMPREF1982_00782 [Clostridiales bacterium oral taxon 876 str. F0540]
MKFLNSHYHIFVRAVDVPIWIIIIVKRKIPEYEKKIVSTQSALSKPDLNVEELNHAIFL